MQLYHGTDKRFRFPDIYELSEHTDFGKGFYLTHELERAKEWGQNRNQFKYRVNVYLIEDNYVEIARTLGLQVKIFQKANKEWAEFVYNNRYIEGFHHNYDIVVGPVADNALQVKFAEMQRYGKTFEQVASEIKYQKFKKPQICFCTDASWKLLKYEKANAYPNRTSHKRRSR